MSSPALAQKLRRNLYLKRHLEELGVLTGRVVRPNELGAPEQFAAIQQAGQKFLGQPAAACEVLFSEKSSEKFKRFLQRLRDANPSSIYVITPQADSCGTLLVPSLDEIRFDFDFAINEDGILIFLTSDFEDSLLLDFSSTSTGEQILKIETQGLNWAQVAY